MCIKLVLWRGVLCCVFLHICLCLTFIPCKCQAAFAVMAETRCSFHQAPLCCSLSQLSSHFAFHLSPAPSLHSIALFFPPLITEAVPQRRLEIDFILQVKLILRLMSLRVQIWLPYILDQTAMLVWLHVQAEQLHGCAFCPQHPQQPDTV